MSEGNNIAIQNLSYVREVDNNNLLSGELDNLSNLTQSTSPQSSPSKERRNKRIILARKGIIMIIYFLSLLFPFSSHATCTPTPDCASIGYTETSCETISLKCPFDPTKLYCFPCDSKYKYSCNQENTIGFGESCNNKYTSCCNTSCSVGAIYYSDKTCSSCVYPNKNPVGIIVKDNELVMYVSDIYLAWGISGDNINGIDETLTNTVSKSITDLAGPTNTLAIVAHYGENANYAATYCYNYSPLGMENTKGEWYLPALGELHTYLYSNWNILQPSGIKLYAEHFSDSYWFMSSTEDSDKFTWTINPSHYDININGKEKTGLFSCFLTIH